MTVQVAGARYTSAYAGQTFAFCGIGCKERFDREPERYVRPLARMKRGTSMQKFISGLILAAGTSSRMGQPKQLLPFRGTILLDWVMAQAESARALDEVIVVLGRAADEIQPRLRNTVPRSSSIRSSPKDVLVPTKLAWPALTSVLRP